MSKLKVQQYAGIFIDIYSTKFVCTEIDMVVMAINMSMFTE